MQDVFPNAELGVERNGGIVAMVRLDEDDVGAPARCDVAEFADERGRHALASMRGSDREVVDVEFTAFTFEFDQLVGDQPAGQGVPDLCDEYDDVVAGEEAVHIGSPWP